MIILVIPGRYLYFHVYGLGKRFTKRRRVTRVNGGVKMSNLTIQKNEIEFDAIACKLNLMYRFSNDIEHPDKIIYLMNFGDEEIFKEGKRYKINIRIEEII